MKCLIEKCEEMAWRRILCRDHYRLARKNKTIHQFPTELNVRRANIKESGYVYVMHSNGLHKIGKTQCLASRLLTIQSAISAHVELVYCVRSDDPLSVEASAHQILTYCRVYGEWFNCSQHEAASAVNEAVEFPLYRKKPLTSKIEKLRSRPVWYFDEHNLPQTKINPNGRKHPDLILE
jgi:hypothetical protein